MLLMYKFWALNICSLLTNTIFSGESCFSHSALFNWLSFFVWAEVTLSFPIHISMSVFVAPVHAMFWQSGWEDPMSTASVSVSRQSHIMLSYILAPRFCNISWTQRCRICFADGYTGTGFHNSAVWFVVVFCKDLRLFQREVCLMRSKDYTYRWA